MQSTLLSDEMREMRRDNIQLRRSLFAELAKPDVNYTIVNEMVIDLEDSQRLLEHSILHHFVHIRSNMTPDEAAEVFGSFHRRYDRTKDREKFRSDERGRCSESKHDKSKFKDYKKGNQKQ
jgi:hypothetical protein